jgi:hypothetical protein
MLVESYSPPTPTSRMATSTFSCIMAWKATRVKNRK